MQCPKCEIIALTMSDRAGVEIDYCPACRGVWLDRGELDKIIERSLSFPAQQPAPFTAQPAAAIDQRRPDKGYKRDDDDDDDDDDRRDYKRKKNRGFLGDIFDF